MDELLRGLQEVVQDTAVLLGLEEEEPVRRYDPPVRPSYTEPVSHPSDSQPQRSYAGDVPIPLTELSITQVCEWALSLGLDATPFWDYGISGAVLVTLADVDFQSLLGLSEAQLSRIRFALRDVREVPPPPTGTLPSERVPVLRKAEPGEAGFKGSVQAPVASDAQPRSIAVHAHRDVPSPSRVDPPPPPPPIAAPSKTAAVAKKAQPLFADADDDDAFLFSKRKVAAEEHALSASDAPTAEPAPSRVELSPPVAAPPTAVAVAKKAQPLFADAGDDDILFTRARKPVIESAVDSEPPLSAACEPPSVAAPRVGILDFGSSIGVTEEEKEEEERFAARRAKADTEALSVLADMERDSERFYEEDAAARLALRVSAAAPAGANSSSLVAVPASGGLLFSADEPDEADLRAQSLLYSLKAHMDDLGAASAFECLGTLELSEPATTPIALPRPSNIAAVPAEPQQIMTTADSSEPLQPLSSSSSPLLQPSSPSPLSPSSPLSLLSPSLLILQSELPPAPPLPSIPPPAAARPEDSSRDGGASRVAALANAFAGTALVPQPRQVDWSPLVLVSTLAQPTQSPEPEPDPRAPSPPPVIESVATGTLDARSRPAPPARGPRRLITSPPRAV